MGLASRAEDTHLPPAPASVRRGPRKMEPSAPGHGHSSRRGPRVPAVPEALRPVCESLRALKPLHADQSRAGTQRRGGAGPRTHGLRPARAEGRRPHLRGLEPRRWGKGAARGACSDPHKRDRVPRSPASPRPPSPTRPRLATSQAPYPSANPPRKNGSSPPRPPTAPEQNTDQTFT